MELASAIEANLADAIAPNLTSADAACDLYEAYVFTLVLRAARVENFVVTYESVGQAPLGTFIFRTSPGHVYTNTQAYCYAVITSQEGLELEVHVGVMVRGRSHVAHECDVLVVERQEAIECRSNRVDPRHTRSELTVECKFYSKTLALGLLRSFIGLSADLNGAENRLVTNVTSASVARLFKAHNRYWTDHLSPGSDGERRFVGEVASVLHRFQSQ